MTQTIIKPDAWVPDHLARQVKEFRPKSDFGKLVAEALHYLPVEQAAILVERISGIVVMESSLELTVIRSRDSRFWNGQEIERHGIVSRKVVTNAGINFIVTAFENTTELENMKYHGIGTGSSAEGATETALVTELTTEYNPDNTRATGTTTDDSGTPKKYVTVATNTLDSGTPALREHGLFSASSAGTLFDRSLFAAINLDGTVGDGLQSTYTLTLNAGG